MERRAMKRECDHQGNWTSRDVRFRHAHGKWRVNAPSGDRDLFTSLLAMTVRVRSRCLHTASIPREGGMAGETTRDVERRNPVRTAVSRVSPGQRIGHSRLITRRSPERSPSVRSAGFSSRSSPARSRPHAVHLRSLLPRGSLPQWLLGAVLGDASASACGSNPAPATKRTLGTPTYPEGFLASAVRSRAPCQTG